MLDSSKETGLFLIDRKKDGLHVLNPQNGTGGNLTYSMLTGNVSSGTAFAWSGGEPTETTTYAGSQFFTRGSLTMTIPRVQSPRPWRRKLTLYMGATNVTAQVGAFRAFLASRLTVFCCRWTQIYSQPYAAVCRLQPEFSVYSFLIPK